MPRATGSVSALRQAQDVTTELAERGLPLAGVVIRFDTARRRVSTPVDQRVRGLVYVEPAAFHAGGEEDAILMGTDQKFRWVKNADLVV